MENSIVRLEHSQELSSADSTHPVSYDKSDVDYVDCGNAANVCSVCERNTKQDDMCICRLCFKEVHNTSPCSKILDNDKNQTEKLCADCHIIDDAPMILATREEENWRGKIIKKERKPRCKYVKPDKISLDTSDNKRHTSVPIMKNANCTDLQVNRYYT